MVYKLVVSAMLTFVATLVFIDDEGLPRTFQVKLKADRLATSAELDAALNDKPVFTDFLAARKLQLVQWVGESPLVDEAGAPAPVGPEALAALMALSGVPHALFSAYVESSSAKAKLGN
jgi:hypothetical protein